MIKLPEYGYTPNNYQALVTVSALKPKEFCKEFNIPARTFHHHKIGTRTMNWQEWQSLVEKVKIYLETTNT